MRWLYDVAIRLLTTAIWMAQPFSPKARLWVQGRKGWRNRLTPAPPDRRPVLWMHVASLGEFEQGRPVLEGFRQQYPSSWIALSFFSPSGYEVRKNYPGADVVCYLPADTRHNARDFLNCIQPDMAVFVKYDLWANYLFQLRQRSIPTFLIAALFRPEQPFFRPWGGLWRQMLGCFSHIFTQNAASAGLVRSIGLTAVSVAGDTRVDRVLQLARDASPIAPPPFEADIIAGSTWPADEDLLLPVIHMPELAHLRWIIAPHEPSERYVRRLAGRLQRPWARYSQWDGQLPADVLIIDSVGLLGRLYRYGRIAYIGGGFGRGIHNTLEPAAYGLPVLFGPNYERFEEARQLVQRGGAFAVQHSEELLRALQRLQGADEYQRASAAVQQFLNENQGATARVLQFIAEHLNPEKR
ncbi:MAG: glycosyltransferase N-terminal domain-containing protein [Saprospiraceae bacterium]|nr:3-deoxy-D-manno-octulosonic acid transferase [Saprospiraceae bacterium]MDW8230136.1 glycosyltransferase N-terminal domain-containing protein [Saprospiraceae bacterium]